MISGLNFFSNFNYKRETSMCTTKPVVRTCMVVIPARNVEGNLWFFSFINLISMGNCLSWTEFIVSLLLSESTSCICHLLYLSQSEMILASRNSPLDDMFWLFIQEQLHSTRQLLLVPLERWLFHLSTITNWYLFFNYFPVGAMAWNWLLLYCECCGGALNNSEYLQRKTDE